jgi:hypothetical protein
MFPALLPEGCCCGKDSGLGKEGQGRSGAGCSVPSPLVGEGGARSAPDEGSVSADRDPSPGSPLLRTGDPPSPTRGEGKVPQMERPYAYAAAVVTPPSTTMVWPVMKVDASEAR